MEIDQYNRLLDRIYDTSEKFINEIFELKKRIRELEYKYDELVRKIEELR